MRSPLRRGVLLFTAVAGIVATWSGVASAITFPADTAWVPLTKAGVPLADPVGDGVNERDIVGDATHPAAYVAQDATNLYFRLRVNKKPTRTDNTFEPFGWGCGLDVNNTAASMEFWASVNGIENSGPDGQPDQVEYWWNQTVVTDKIDDQLEVLVAKFAATQPAGYARSVAAAGSNFGGDADFFIDWAIPIATIRAGGMGAPGVPAGAAIRVACGSSSNARRMDADPLGPSDATTLTGIFSDPILCTETGCVKDTDGDGIADSVETTLGTDPTKADSDGDGIPDNVETSTTGSVGPYSKIDTDSDGKIDALDTDSDGDGVADGTDGTGDVDMDGKPNYRDADSSGMSDAGPGDTSTPNDRDGDGVPNAEEIMLGTDPDKADSDGDGILDGVELSTSGSTGPFSKIDTDGDGTIDALDTDSDGDGALDGSEGTGDTDGDGTPNYRDGDSLGSVEGGAGSCAFGGSAGTSALALAALAALAAGGIRRRCR